MTGPAGLIPLGAAGPPTLCRRDREVLDIWAEHGIPDDRSTREHAYKLLMLLWADHQGLERTVLELCDLIPERD